MRDKLRRGSDIYKNIESLRAYIEANEAIAEGMHDPQLLQLINTQTTELNFQYAKLLKVRSMIDKCISSLDDRDLRSIMTMRYLGHLSTFAIADLLHYGRNSVNRKHKQALSKLLEIGADQYLDY
ncbi:MAG: sigma-70 family RNA polymerase sigma factor [Clostridia bacterium]|nr:sigma-70 family RNA polymerase sigma factor [Clostridia bacterium]